MKKDASDPIVPKSFPWPGIPEGITLRQYYAGMAMQGILMQFPVVSREDLENAGRHERMAKLSADMADALIVELSKEKS